MGYLPQEESIFRKLTVEQNLLAILETLPLNRKQRLARCDELLEQFGITHVARNLALTLSGGEKRRLTIARSLITNPNLLMLDEPFSGVDPIAVAEVQQIILSLRDTANLGIVITDHKRARDADHRGPRLPDVRRQGRPRGHPRFPHQRSRQPPALFRRTFLHVSARIQPGDRFISPEAQSTTQPRSQNKQPSCNRQHESACHRDRPSPRHHRRHQRLRGEERSRACTWIIPRSSRRT